MSIHLLLLHYSPLTLKLKILHPFAFSSSFDFTSEIFSIVIRYKFVFKQFRHKIKTNMSFKTELQGVLNFLLVVFWVCPGGYVCCSPAEQPGIIHRIRRMDRVSEKVCQKIISVGLEGIKINSNQIIF